MNVAQEIQDMLSVHIPPRDIEEYMVQGYGIARSKVQELIKQTTED